MVTDAREPQERGREGQCVVWRGMHISCNSLLSALLEFFSVSWKFSMCQAVAGRASWVSKLKFIFGLFTMGWCIFIEWMSWDFHSIWGKSCFHGCIRSKIRQKYCLQTITNTHVSGSFCAHCLFAYMLIVQQVLSTYLKPNGSLASVCLCLGLNGFVF